jgi:hypothetical protein
MGSADGMCSRWDSLHVGASVSPVEKRSKETEEVEEESLPSERPSLMSRLHRQVETLSTCLLY